MTLFGIAHKDIYDFVGRRVAVIGVSTIFLGFVLFVLEIGLAFSLQSFFYGLGLIGERPSYFASWFPYENLPIVLGVFLVFGTLRGVGTWAQSYVTGMVIIDFESRMRGQLLRWSFANRSANVGAVADLFNDKIIGASNFISSLLSVTSRLTISGLLILSLLQISFKITVVVLVALVLLAIPLRFLNRRILDDSGQLHVNIASTLDRLLLGIKNSLLLHIHGTSGLEEERAQMSLRDYRQGYGRYYLFSGLKGTLPYIYGIWLISLIAFASHEFDSIEPALLVSYLYLFLRFVQSLGELANLGSYLTLTRPRMAVLWSWWTTDRLRVDKGVALLANDANTSGLLSDDALIGWTLEDVSLRYADGQPLVLDGIDLTIKPGATLVIKGPSGSGKSSLLALLLGMQSPSHGSVAVIDDKGASRDMNAARAALLQVIGYVGPESFLIPGTIRDNLNYGASMHYHDADMIKALELAECGFVFAQPGGLGHVLTEKGEGLSAGQKQRLSLARALLRKPKVLILDEATANLDFETEATIVETLSHLKGRVTLCIVSHRAAFDDLADIQLNLDLTDIIAL